jgi:hypothetical protein
LVEDRYKDVEKIHRAPGDAIEGDHVRIYCRKNSPWESNVRGSDGHHYFKTNARMNALAILRKTYTNLQK